MSRIDEALARAKNFTAATAVPPIDASALDYPVEPDAPAPEAAEPVVVRPAAPAVADLPLKDLPLKVEAPVASPGNVPVASPGNVIEAPGRIEDLPIAEKLMLAGETGDRTAVEQYRRLAGRLLLAKAEHGITTVMITSALQGEGKTLTAANLALTLTESYKRSVLLVDADLRRPCVHQIFQVPNASGLNDGLKPDAERRVPLMQFSERLTLLTAGRPDSDPMSVLSGSRMRRVLDEAKERFDLVLIDTPPLALLTDAHLMSSMVDVVLLVVRAGVTPLPQIKAAIGVLGQDRILGVVLNHAEMDALPASYSYYEAPRAAEAD